jgi:hypothetical protein
LRTSLFDYDDGFAFNDLGFDLLLLGCFQRPLIVSFLAHTLNGVHNIALLRQEGVAEISRPLDVISQPLYHGGQSGQGLDARIPGLFRHCIGKFLILQIRILFEPSLEKDDFERICRSRKYLSQQRVWIERNRRYERIQLLGRNFG